MFYFSPGNYVHSHCVWNEQSKNTTSPLQKPCLDRKAKPVADPGIKKGVRTVNIAAEKIGVTRYTIAAKCAARVWGHAPPENFRPFEIVSGAVLGQNSRLTPPS